MDLTILSNYARFTDSIINHSLIVSYSISHLAHLLIFSVYDEIEYIFKFPTHWLNKCRLYVYILTIK